MHCCIAIVLTLTACSPSRYLAPHQALLVKNKIEIEKPYLKEIKAELPKYYKQNPNRKFLVVINSRPYFYFIGSKGNDNWWKRFQRNSLGETPVIADTVFANSTVKAFKSYLRGMGYYYPSITYDVRTTKRQRATVTYKVELNKVYKLGSYDLQIADKVIYDLVKPNMKESFMRIGWPLREDNMIQEQDRIINLLRNNGYYSISKEFVSFDLDTNAIDGYVKLALNILNKDDTTFHMRYYVNEVHVDIDNITPTPTEFVAKDSLQLGAISYSIDSYKINPIILGRNILLTKGELYSQQKFNRTYTRMADLNIFRFTNIQTRSTDINADSGIVNYTIKLIPATKYTFSMEPQALTSDQNNLVLAQSRNYGLAALFQLTNRNVFRNAEILQLSFRSSFEAQGAAATPGFFNSTEQSLTASVIMPRILFFSGFDKSLILQSTRTIISTSAIYEVNIEYERRVLNSSLNYQFNRKNSTYYFAPVELSFISSQVRNDALRLRAENDFFLQNLFSNNFIMNSRVGFIYSNKGKSKGLSYVVLRWDALELAGNVLGLIGNATNAPRSDDGSRTLLGVRYFQYAKSQIDFRYNTKLDVNNSTAFRVIAGLALPYGNTPVFVPFERRFFIGGVNSLRAWQPRSIGPGSFEGANQLDFSGEVKLEFNAEYRFNIYNRWLEGAVFTDAGNIWSAKKDENRPNADFAINRFISELAWDAGVGTRLNLSVFIIRFDFAIPIRFPRNSVGNRWVISGISENNWLLNNTNFNFGIGYPF